MKSNLTFQDKPNAGKPGCGEIVTDYSLPDYLLVSTVLTVDYPVPAIASSIRQEEGRGWNIPEGGGSTTCWVGVLGLGFSFMQQYIFRRTVNIGLSDDIHVQ